MIIIIGGLEGGQEREKRKKMRGRLSVYFNRGPLSARGVGDVWRHAIDSGSMKSRRPARGNQSVAPEPPSPPTTTLTPAALARARNRSGARGYWVFGGRGQLENPLRHPDSAPEHRRPAHIRQSPSHTRPAPPCPSHRREGYTKAHKEPPTLWEHESLS
ncbi:hypothetical protein E2C01_043871 [Portunus trituberculatus]|uniref:Uncharacterized protein n=1 Tax=Portunus trituberculatus TaxID=210409 RepID=A0A5B7FYV4_PORTR|nr:hypothetical protein [Portunus trituberculatus]